MKKLDFESDYFDGYFSRAVGAYTKKDLQISKNWFYGWLKEIEKQIPRLVNGKGKKVLEIGCSLGAMSSLLRDEGFNVTATDISKYVIGKAKKLSPNLNFKVLDIQKKTTMKDYYDFVFALEVLEHLENPEKALKNINAMLLKGGMIIFSSPYPYKWSYSDPTHVSVKHPDEWVKLLRNTGFKKVGYRKFSLLPFFYKYNKSFHFSFPFHIPSRYINTPVIFFGEK